MRSVLFQIHWFLGITAGFVLAVMGITGALMSFEPEILATLNPGIVTVTPTQRPVLPAPMLITRFQQQRPDARIMRMIVRRDATRAAAISYAPGTSKERRTTYVDPATGTILGEARGEGFYGVVEDLHRWLALPGHGNGVGRQITGFAALSLIYFALSGLYLRWPRRPLDWRNWLVLDLRMTGRNLYRALHAVVGGWVLLFYLISAGTGLWWSYDWYRSGVQHLLAVERNHAPRGAGAKDAQPDLPLAWAQFEQVTRGRAYDTVTAGVRDGDAVQFRAMLPGARHDRVSDEFVIDGRTGAVLSDERYADRTVGADLLTSVFEVHRGAYFGLPGRVAIMLSSATMPLFTVTGLLLYIGRRRRKHALATIADDAPSPPPGAATTIVAFATQTGTAERIARLTAQALPDAVAMPVAGLDGAVMAKAKRLLVVASTYGEGEPPDNARCFGRALSASPPALPHLSYAVLALGDREYPNFCAFGHEVDRWLHASGATRLFDPVEMDGDDADAQRQWQQQLAGLGAHTDQPDWAPAPMTEWRLVERRLLNPGSSGDAAWHIALAPSDPAVMTWAAGDILEVSPQQDPARVAAFIAAHDLPATDDDRTALMTRLLPIDTADPLDIDTLPPLPHRDYSIASVAESGRVELIVRACRAADGFSGLGSGWLSAHAPLGGTVMARVRANPGFHAPDDRDTPLILIGNGTGLAGLMAHLRDRAVGGGAPASLFFGERHPAQDDFLRAERDDLTRCGVLRQTVSAWSRAGTSPRYVQDAVAASAEHIRTVVADGGAIYVCGSLAGMATGVNAALTAILGDAVLEDMLADGRYRRDIY